MQQFCLLIMMALFSMGAICQEKGSIHITIQGTEKILSLPIPLHVLPVASKVTVTTEEQLIKTAVSYDLLWHKSKHNSASVRVLNLVFDKTLSPQQLTIQWAPSNKSIIQSVAAIKYKGHLVYPNINWLRQVLLLTDNKKIDEQWYRQNQKLIATYLADEAALTKNKYPRRVASQWLYDRPQAFYQLYLATEDDKWKQHADRFVDFYKSQINEEGFFKLAKPKDVKYLMGRSLVYDYLLNQNQSALETLRAIFKGTLSWSARYFTNRGFWTERHHAAVLNVAVSYWEVTGDVQALARIEELIASLMKMTFSPESGWRLRNCPQHTFKSHEGWGDETPACSPWMMALIADSLWRYYWLTENTDAVKLLSAFASFTLNEGIYFGEKRLAGRIVPKYIASLDNPTQEELEPWSDLKHTCDVATMVGKGVFMKRLLKQDLFLEKQLFSVMSAQCKADNLAVIEKYKYVKLDKLTSKPPRMFNWQYSTTDDLPWLMFTLNQSEE